MTRRWTSLAVAVLLTTVAGPGTTMVRAADEAEAAAWKAAAPRDPIAYALTKVQEVPDPFFKTRVLTAMAGKYAACLEKDQARHLLRMARHAARFIGNPHDRVWALAHIGFQYVRAGEPTRGEVLFALAHRTALDKGNVRGMSSLLTEIAILAADAGLIDIAARVAADIDDFWCRAEATSRVAQAMVVAAREEEGRGLVGRLVGEPNRLFAQADLARALGRAGFTSKALETARALATPRARGEALADLVSISLDAGRLDEALEIARSIDQRHEPLRDPLTRRWMPATPRKPAKRWTDDPEAPVLDEPAPVEDRFAPLFKSMALVEVSAALDRGGEMARAFRVMLEARHAVEGVSSRTARAKLLTDIGAGHDERGQPLRASWILDDGFKNAVGLDNPVERARTLAWVAGRCIAAEMGGDGLGLTELAEDEAERLSPVHDERDEALVEVARLWLRQARYDRSMRLIRRVGRDELRHGILVEQADAAIASGRYDVAQDTAKHLQFHERPRGSAEVALAAIAGAWIRMDRYDDALEILRWIDAPDLRAIKLAELGARWALKGYAPREAEVARLRNIAEKIVFVARPVAPQVETRPWRGRLLVKRPDEL